MSDLINKSKLLYNKALESLEKNRVSDSIDFLEKSLRINVKDIEVLNLMGICQYLLCNFDKAYFYWSESLKYKGESNRAGYYLQRLSSDEFTVCIYNYNLAISTIRDLKYREAIKLLEKVLSYDDDFIEPYAILGMCYYELKNYKSAKENFEYALSLDQNNKKYLIYLNEVNKLNKNNGDKNKINFKYLFASTLTICALFIILYSNMNDKYISIKDKVSEYEAKIEQFNGDLETSKKYSNKLKSEIDKIKLHKTDVDAENLHLKSETDIFNEAIKNFKSKNYLDAIEKFSYIHNSGVEKDLVAESTYYIAVCYERNAKFKDAEKYYDTYIKNYKDKNYYDDALYNYGLMLYRQGKVDMARTVLTELKKEVPNSIFVNSKVEYILNNEN